MAVITPGMLGEAAGKLGNVIFYTVDGQLRARKKPQRVKNPRTPKQTAQRMRVKGIARLYRKQDYQLLAAWKRLAEGIPKSGYNLFMSKNIGCLDDAGQLADVKRFCVTDGGLRKPDWAQGEWTEDGKMRITWDKTAGTGRTSDLDRLMIAVHGYSRVEKQVMTLVLEETTTERKKGQYTWQPTDEMEWGHVYGFFKSYDGDVSESFYLGEIDDKRLRMNEGDDAGLAEEGEGVAVVEDGEAAAEVAEGLKVGGGDEDFVAAGGGGGENVATGVPEGGVAGVADAVGVFADAIDGGDVGLVFDGTGAEEGEPGFAAGGRPVGNEDGKVVVAGIAAPDGETEVVADEGGNAEATEGEYRAGGAGGIVFAFAAQAEAMALVVMEERAVGKGDEHAVVGAGAVGVGSGTHDEGVLALRPAEHGVADAGKAGGEGGFLGGSLGGGFAGHEAA